MIFYIPYTGIRTITQQSRSYRTRSKCVRIRGHWSPFGGMKFHVSFLKDPGPGRLPSQIFLEKNAGNHLWPGLVSHSHFAPPHLEVGLVLPKFQQSRETRLEGLKVNRQNPEPIRTGPTQRARESCRQCWGNWAPMYESWKHRIVGAKGSSQVFYRIWQMSP